MWVELVAILAAAVIGASVPLVLGHEPGEKRTHLFETESGDRASPFEGVSEGAGDETSRCGRCGSAVPERSYRVCSSCLVAPGDD